MKKIRLLIILICYILSSLSVDAKRVDVEKAKKIAHSHVRTPSRLSARKDFRLSKTVSRRIVRKHAGERKVASSQQQQQPQSQQEEETMFYVFTTNGSGGFIIVSGDDIAKPVLGYSDNGTYDENNPNLAFWMEMLSQEIADAIENDASQDEQIKAEWESFENEGEKPVFASGDYVDPLVKTKWNQSAPYNNWCPKVSGTPTYTGCVATAMAQIMKYHGHPTNRTVTIPGYTTEARNINIPNIAPTSYNWNNMTNTYSSSSTETSADAVAELMYHCGVSVEMDYNTNSSSAYSSAVVSSLKTYFNYDAGIVQHNRSYYSYTEWINLLKTELRANRPVYYSGQGSGGGHAFVCDGYDIDDLFHFNWGWGGSSDGYFEVSALNPDAIGIGGGSGGYNQEQAIITGIQPNTGEQPISTIQLRLSTFSATKTSLNNLNGSFNVTAGRLRNIGTETLTNMYLGVLLYKQDDSYYDYKTVQQSTFDLPPRYSYTTRTLLTGYSLPNDLPAGTYKLYPAISASSGIPSIIPGENGNKYITVVVKSDGKVTLSESSETANLSLVSLKVIGNLYHDKIGCFEAEITNSGMTDYNSQLSLKLGSQTITDPIVIPAKTTKTIGFSGEITLSPANNYSLSIWYDPNNADGTPSVQLGDAISPIEVKAEPANPNLSLTPAPSFLDGSDAVPQNAPNLTVTIKNTGGLYQGNVSVYVYPYNSSGRLGSFGTVFVSIDKNETKEIQYNNVLYFLTPGQQYDASVYAVEYGYVGDDFTFTLAEPVYSSDATLKNLVVKDTRTQIPLTLRPAFSSSITEYTAVASDGTTAVSIIGESTNNRARFTNIENGILNGENTTFNLEVTAEDGIIQKTYVITITTDDNVNAQVPIINPHPQSAAYTEGAMATALSVTASVADGGTLSYQWYSNTINSNTGGTVISGATSSSYTPSTNTVGIAYYYVVVTNTNTGTSITGLQTVTATSNVAVITVNAVLVNAQVPNITAHPQLAAYTKDEPATALSVTANVTDGGTLSYQWYSNTINSNTGGTAISGATSASYTPSTATVGIAYYYVVVTNTNTGANITGLQTATKTSDVAVITVNAVLVNAQVPNITAHPQLAAYTKDEPATALSVTASVTDGGTLSYQWYNTSDSNAEGTAISGATLASYTPSTATVGIAYYYVVVTNTNTDESITGLQTAIATSNVAVITVNAVLVNAQTPTITVHPQSAIYTEGKTATALSVMATVEDGGTLSYQWYSNTSNSNIGGTVINDATSENYTPSTATVGIAYYYVVVTNTNTDESITGLQTATATSNVAEITVNAPVHAQTPTIAVDPQSAIYTEGKTATNLSVTANVDDGGTLSYQWYSNTINSNIGGTAINEAILENYTPSTATVGIAYYYVVVTNTNTGTSITGSQTAIETSDVAEITVNALVHARTPTIETHPQSAVYTEGKTATNLSVTARVEDGGTLSYQWYNTSDSNIEGTAINDATSASYTPSTATVGIAYYYVVVTNTNTGASITGSQTATKISNVAEITVNALVHARTPTIETHPQSAVYTEGKTATNLSVTANVDDGGTLSYQWYSNTSDSNTGGAAISGATSSSYTPSTATVGIAYYYVVVTNTNTGASITGSQTATATSNVAEITVNVPVHAQMPTIETHPQSNTYTIDVTVTDLSVTANVTDGGTLSYQWYNTLDSNIEGTAINDATSASYTPSTTTVGITYYYVVVTNTNTDASITGSQTATAASNVAEITVNKISSFAPEVPTLADKMATSVTLNTIPGDVEYSKDGVNWQDSPTFGDLTPNTSYTFYARMKETDTHYVSPISEALEVVTHAGIEAELLSIEVNGNSVSIVNDELYYPAQCDETSITLDIEKSVAAYSSVTVNGVEYNNQDIPLSKDITVVDIKITSGNDNTTNNYTLTVSKTIEANSVLFQRWDDVLAINSNPETNGGYRNIEGVRWYNGNMEVSSSEWFIRLIDAVENYHVEINIAGKWYNVCGAPRTKKIKEIIAYPNPVSIGANLNLQLPNDFIGGYMDVVTLAGSIVKQKLSLSNKISTISVSDWAPGVYLLDIVAPNGNKESVKIVVTN